MDKTALSEPATTLLGVPFLLTLAMVLSLSFLTAFAAVYLFRRMTKSDPSPFALGSDFLNAGNSVFVFSDENLIFVSSKGQGLLDDINGRTNSWHKLRAHLSELNPGLEEKLDRLSKRGTPFFETVRSKDQFTGEDVTHEVEGRPHRGFVTISMQKWSSEKMRCIAEIEGSDIDAKRSHDIASALEESGMPLWSRSVEGDILWCNDAFKDLMPRNSQQNAEHPEKMPTPFVPPDQDAAPIANRRVSISTGKGQDATRWYKLHEHVNPDGSIFGFAEDASDVVKVETTLNMFVATLTESFAHLSTGLAIFDSNRRLTIFNPAIADLMQIDPGWLATRPGFRDFMSRGREGRMMPEQKTAADWKIRVQQIERGAELGTLCEKWVLPSGQTFKVSGRPHPHGAIALMIEDISSHISLERQYRSEIEQSRATLDFLTEAVCMFDTTGALVYANSACADLWDFEIENTVDRLNIVAATANWGAFCKPTPVWGDLREFVTSLDQRATWTADVELENGNIVGTVFAPLPDGSTLAVFTTASKPAENAPEIDDRLSALSRAHKEDTSILELAIEHMREAVKTMTANREATAHPPVHAAQEPNDIDETVSYADRLLLLRRNDTHGPDKTIDTLSQDLLALLKEKEAELTLSCETIVEDGHLAADVKRLLINIMLVTRSLVAHKENVDLSIAEMGEGISISCMFKSLPELANDPEKAAGLTFRIMMRYLKELHGEGTIDALDRRDFLKISCTIPTRQIDGRAAEDGPSLIEA